PVSHSSVGERARWGRASRSRAPRSRHRTSTECWCRQPGTLDPAPGRWPRPQSARTSPPRPARSARLATKLNTVSGEISRKELLRTVLPKTRAISVARYNPHDSGDHSLVPRLSQRIVHLSHQLLHLL